MIAQVKDNGGTKTLEQISGSIPTGNPVGSLITTYKKIQPRNYLYCDGSTFNAGQYPALYLYLGSNVLPDYRECTMVGAEENTTDDIATHDVYAQGEFKDDQFQMHGHKSGNESNNPASGVPSNSNGFFGSSATYQNNNTNAVLYPIKPRLNPDGSAYTGADPRFGDVTHGKQKAVYVYIKAVDGVDISDEDTFLVTVKNFVEEKNSYSTTEMLTGGKWIDGKPIYRNVFKITSTIATATWGWGGLSSSIFADVDTLIECKGTLIENGTNSYSVCCYARKSAGFFVQNNYAPANSYFIVEYTKTTD